MRNDGLVLVVDDNWWMRALIRTGLEEAGFAVAEAPGGAFARDSYVGEEDVNGTAARMDGSAVRSPVLDHGGRYYVPLTHDAVFSQLSRV